MPLSKSMDFHSKTYIVLKMYGFALQVYVFHSQYDFPVPSSTVRSWNSSTPGFASVGWSSLEQEIWALFPRTP